MQINLIVELAIWMAPVFWGMEDMTGTRVEWVASLKQGRYG